MSTAREPLSHPSDADAPLADTGLLSPVRAGSPAEAATSDAACLQGMLDAEAGLARVQAGFGTVPPQAARVITSAARAEHFDARALAIASRAAANPVVALVRALAGAVADKDPDAAHFVHQGSTSQDILDTGLMLVAARTLDVVSTDLDRTADALGALAERHRDTLMPARTLGQHAVPSTFGLKAAGWLQGVLDAADRLRQVRRHALPVQLGGAAGTLAGYVEYARVVAGLAPDAVDAYVRQLPAAYAAELGLAEPAGPWHTVRTPLADLAAALTLTGSVLGTFAADVQLLSRTETAEVSEPAAEGRGASSAMPHKRNPALAALIRSAAYQLPGLTSTLAHAAVMDDERPAGAWHAEWEPLRTALRLAGGAAHTAAELAEGLTVHPGRMRANLALTAGLVVSERLAAALSPVLGRAPAKALVSAASARAAAEGRHLADVLAAAPELTGRHDADALHALCAPEQYTGAAHVLVDSALARLRATRPHRRG